MVNTPLALVTASVLTLVARLSAVTVTPGTTEPWPSTTLPVMRARVSCANAGMLRPRSSARQLRVFIVLLPEEMKQCCGANDCSPAMLDGIAIGAQGHPRPQSALPSRDVRVTVC